jgi:hypothetical protein
MREQRPAGQWAALIILIGSVFVTGSAVAEPNYTEVMRAIAQDIATRASDFPQLKNFTTSRHLRDLDINYAYHTHRSTIRGGWRAAAPEPDDDGIWFAINFHDPDSRAQIDAQPVTIFPLCIGNKRVTFLVLEGKKTKSVADSLRSILERHGVTEVGRGEMKGSGVDSNIRNFLRTGEARHHCRFGNQKAATDNPGRLWVD